MLAWLLVACWTLDVFVALGRRYPVQCYHGAMDVVGTNWSPLLVDQITVVVFGVRWE